MPLWTSCPGCRNPKSTGVLNKYASLNKPYEAPGSKQDALRGCARFGKVFLIGVLAPSSKEVGFHTESQIDARLWR